jgi:hypothetical protein
VSFSPPLQTRGGLLEYGSLAAADESRPLYRWSMAKKSNDSAAQAHDARTPAKKSAASASETRRQSTESSAAESATLENQPTHEEIATRAYFRHLSRQGQPGDPVADWFEAERELKTNGHKSA